MDKIPNGETRTAEKGMQLIHKMCDALLKWTAVPPRIIQTIQPERASRNDTQQLLARSARKLCEDLGATVSLLSTGFVGPSHALIRMCRENVVAMLWLGLAPKHERERYARLVIEQKPAATRVKLHRLATTVLARLGAQLSMSTRVRFDTATLSGEQFRTEEALAKQDGSAGHDLNFNALVHRLAELLARDYGNEANALLTTAIDYWIESEIIHNGFNAIEVYHVNGGNWFENVDRIEDILVLLIDLRVITILTNTALLHGFDAIGRLPPPTQIEELRTVVQEIRDFLH